MVDDPELDARHPLELTGDLLRRGDGRLDGLVVVGAVDAGVNPMAREEVIGCGLLSRSEGLMGRVPACEQMDEAPQFGDQVDRPFGEGFDLASESAHGLNHTRSCWRGRPPSGTVDVT